MRNFRRFQGKTKRVTGRRRGREGWARRSELWVRVSPRDVEKREPERKGQRRTGREVERGDEAGEGTSQRARVRGGALLKAALLSAGAAGAQRCWEFNSTSVKSRKARICISFDGSDARGEETETEKRKVDSSSARLQLVDYSD